LDRKLAGLFHEAVRTFQEGPAILLRRRILADHARDADLGVGPRKKRDPWPDPPLTGGEEAMNRIPSITRLGAAAVLAAGLAACEGTRPTAPSDTVAAGVDIGTLASRVQGPRPLKGSLSGAGGVPGGPCSVEPPGIMITATAQGQVTHLGATTLVLTACVSPEFLPIGPFTVSLTAANGDRLDGMLTGDLVLTPIGFDMEIAITGGTGRFAYAAGQYTVHVEQSAPLQPFSATLEGWVEY
jgi:hypothetical protein